MYWPQERQEEAPPQSGGASCSIITRLVPTLRVGMLARRSCGVESYKMARDRYKFIEGGYPHFLTCTIVNWIPIFASKPCAEFVLNSLRFLQEEKRLVLYAYVILENHLHLIASAKDLSLIHISEPTRPGKIS